MSETITAPSIEEAEEFLRFFHGEAPEDFIYLQAQRVKQVADKSVSEEYGEEENSEELNSTDEHVSGNKLETRPVWFSSPEKFGQSVWFDGKAGKWSIYYCTSTIKGERKGDYVVDADGRKARHSLANTSSLGAIFVDIDAIKQLGLEGAEFYSELRLGSKGKDFSALIRSSKHGIQGIFKLDKPFQIDGSREKYNKHLKDLLVNIAYYYGGDFKATLPQQLLRVPGSLNNKPEYPNPYRVTAEYFDTVYTLKELQDSFSNVHQDDAPMVVKYAVVKALQDIYVPGSRHDVARQFAGTMHMAYVDTYSMKRLMSYVVDYFDDKSELQDRLLAIDTTYNLNRDSDPIGTLKESNAEIHHRIMAICEWWMKHKVAFCKKKGISYTPERPTSGSDEEQPVTATIGDVTFVERDGQTFVRQEKGEKPFANFILRILGTVVKSDDNREVWRVEYSSPKTSTTIIEVPSRDHINAQKFIAVCPSGASVIMGDLWQTYITWKEATRPPVKVYETKHYGVLNPESASPIILLSGEQHSQYEFVPGNSEDTASPALFSRDMEREEARAYLQEFLEKYSQYHSPKYLWPALGWFCATPISAFIRVELGGFPVLFTYGIPGSGKSELINKVIANHIGVKPETSFGASTIFGMTQHLVSNNVIPLTVDEYRDESDKKTAELQQMVRSLWDMSIQSKGRADLTVRKNQMVGCLSITGEQLYKDTAALQRTFIIQVDKTHVKKVRKLKLDNREEYDRIMENYRWLHDRHHNGKLGSLIINFMRNNIDIVKECIEDAMVIVDKKDSEYTVGIERKRKGIISVFAGLLLLQALCYYYEVDFKFPNREIIDSVYQADPNIVKGQSDEENTLQQLFDVTDSLIVSSLGTTGTVHNKIYTIDPKDDNIAYFDTRRWQRSITTMLRRGVVSAALMSYEDLEAILHENYETDDNTVILGFPDEAHGNPFEVNTVAFDLEKVKKLYRVNVSFWKQVAPVAE